MMKITLIAALLLATSPVAAQVSTNKKPLVLGAARPQQHLTAPRAQFAKRK
jgi:hypothetical protein